MKDLGNRISAEVRAFLQDYPNWANAVLGSTALAMIEKRVRRLGKGSADGSQWKPYSTKPTFISPYKDKDNRGSFTGKGYSDKVFRELKGKRKPTRFVAKDGGQELQWFTVRGKHLALLPGGYRRIREIETRQVSFKDFERTGEMWKSIRPVRDGGTADISTVRTSNGFTTTCGTDNELSKKKLEGHYKREGKEILMVTKQEEANLDLMFNEYVTNKINKMFNG